MSDVRLQRVLFYYAEWQEAYCQLQYDTREKEFEDQSWECSNTKTKKNIIEFRGFTPSGRLLERSAFSEISDNRRSYERIVRRDRGSFH